MRPPVNSGTALPLKPICMPAVHGCLHERSPQNSSTESSFLASTNPVLTSRPNHFSRVGNFRCCRAAPSGVTEVAPVDSVSITSIHSYSSYQPVQDYAGSDYRRSRSAAENIIPNTHEAGNWLPNLLPHLEGRVTTSALNVPIQRGSLLDVSLAFSDDSITVDAVNDAIRSASRSRPELVQVSEDPIVSSDVIGQSCTVLFDAPGTIKAGSRMIKLLGWYENLGHAARLLDVARLYTEMEAAGV